MTAALFERTGKEPPPEQNPALNAPLVTFVASERAGHVNGQILGRTDYAYTIFQHPKQIAWMWRDGGLDAERVAAELRPDPRPAPPARRHGHAARRWSTGERDDQCASRAIRSASSTSSTGRARSRTRAELARAPTGSDHIDVLVDVDAATLALPVGCPTAFPKPRPGGAPRPRPARGPRHVGADGRVVPGRARRTPRAVGRRGGELGRTRAGR